MSNTTSSFYVHLQGKLTRWKCTMLSVKLLILYLKCSNHFQQVSVSGFLLITNVKNILGLAIYRCSLKWLQGSCRGLSIGSKTTGIIHRPFFWKINGLRMVKIGSAGLMSIPYLKIQIFGAVFFKGWSGFTIFLKFSHA